MFLKQLKFKSIFKKVILCTIEERIDWLSFTSLVHFDQYLLNRINEKRNSLLIFYFSIFLRSYCRAIVLFLSLNLTFFLFVFNHYLTDNNIFLLTFFFRRNETRLTLTLTPLAVFSRIFIGFHWTILYYFYINIKNFNKYQ